MTKESERRVEEILSCEKCTYFACEQCEISYNDKKLIREYIEELKQNFENKAKEG